MLHWMVVGGRCSISLIVFRNAREGSVDMIQKRMDVKVSSITIRSLAPSVSWLSASP